MGNVKDGRTGVVHPSAVHQTRCAQIRGHSEGSRKFKPVAPQPEQQLRPARDPADPRPNRRDVTLGQSGRQICANPIVAGVTTSLGPHPQTANPGVRPTHLNDRFRVIALEGPARGGGTRNLFEAGIGNQIPTGALLHDFHGIHQGFPATLQRDLKLLGREVEVAVVQPSGHFHGGPNTLGRFIGVRPIGAAPQICLGIDQLQTRTAPVRPPTPLPAIGISHLGHVDQYSRAGHHSQIVGRKQFIRPGQRHAFAPVGQGSGISAHGVVGRQVRVFGSQLNRILRHHQVAAWGQHHAAGKAEADAAGELPVAEINNRRTAVEEFHILVVVGTADRMVHQLVEHDVVRTPRGVGHARGRLIEPPNLRGTIRLPTRAHAIFLAAKSHGIQHPRSGGINQEQGFAGRAQPEAQLVLIKHQMPPGRDGSSRGNPESVGGNGIRQYTAGEVERGGVAVVEFHEVQLRIIGVREKFVDDHAGERLGFQDFRAAGTAPDPLTGGPRPGIRRAIAWTHQAQGMSGSIRRHGPRCLRAIAQSKQRITLPSLQREFATLIRQSAGIGTKNLRQPGGLTQVGGIGRHDQEFAGP